MLPEKTYPITTDGLVPTGFLPEQLLKRKTAYQQTDPEIIYEYHRIISECPG